MDTVGRTLLLIALVVPLLSLEYCPGVTEFGLQWPRIAVGKSVTNDCSAINSSWTGKFTAVCTKNAAENITWNYKAGCGCELRTVLIFYQTQVSRVNEASFLRIVNEFENAAYKNFTNKDIYLTLLSTLKNSMCKKKPSIKSPEWDKIQKYCQTPPDDFLKQLRDYHFEKLFCQKVGTNGEKDVVFPSFGGSRPKPNTVGGAIVDVNKSPSQENVTQAVNNTLASITSSGCTVTNYYVVNGTLKIKAKTNLTTEKHKKIREGLELALISVSLLAIICSLVVLSCVRIKSSQTSEKLFIHKSLLFAWGIGYAVYIMDIAVFDSRNEKTAACTAVAVIRHFFQTAVFTWMLVEAVNLFIKLVKVISTKTFYMTYLAIGWGIPALIVGIMAAARTETYDMSQAIIEEFMCGSIKFTAKIERTSCWLNGSKWLYTGPVFAILLVNLLIFVMLLKVVFGKLATKYNNDQMMKTRKGLKSVATLLPLLGVTWLFGLFIDFHEVLAYIFILLTSTQGVVFCIFHCILDEQVRRTIGRKLTRPHLSKNVFPGKGRNEYTVNRPAEIELVKKRRPNETVDTFKEIT
ncbi:uncharacterized protein LOC144642912 [Oculina patagonica]